MPRSMKFSLLALPAILLSMSVHGAGPQSDGRQPLKVKAAPTERTEKKTLLLGEPFLVRYAEQAQPFSDYEAGAQNIFDSSPQTVFGRTWATGVAAKALTSSVNDGRIETSLDAQGLLGRPMSGWKSLPLPTRAYLAGAVTYLVDIKRRKEAGSPLLLEGSEVDDYLQRFKTSTLMLLNCAEGMSLAASLARQAGAHIDRGDNVQMLLLTCRMQWSPTPP